MRLRYVIQLLETQLEEIDKSEAEIRRKGLKIRGAKVGEINAQIKVMREAIKDAIKVLKTEEAKR